MTEQNTPKMTHDEMIDVLKGLVFGTFDRTTAKEREALDMAISALSAPSANVISIDQANAMIKSYVSHYEENKGEWIPVSERLPEKNIPCLVAVGNFNLTQIAMYSDLMGTIDHRIFYQGDVGYDNFIDITEYVNAWQPLPEPYKAESEDKE